MIGGEPTSALNLISCYFTIEGGAFKVHVSEDEASQKDVCLANVNLKLHCRLQEEQRAEMQRREKGASVEEGQWGAVGGERRRGQVRRKEEKEVQGKEDKENPVRNEHKSRGRTTVEEHEEKRRRRQKG